MIKKIFGYSICIIFVILLTIYVSSKKNVKATTMADGIENFPESYQPYLEELKKNHPNWTFTALYTNLDWNYVIQNENIFGKNLVPKSYNDRWKNTKPGEYNVEVDAGWVDCSKQSLLYTMDPRNFLNESRIFQFEELSFNSNSNSVEGIEKILYGTEFYNQIVSYLTSSGSTVTMNKKYSDLIYSAGIQSKVSSYHLASRIKQEVGPFLSHSSISGKVTGYEGLYNFYNIGATSSSEPMGAIINGLKYARDGNGASEATKTKYLIPWNTKERAITGGGIFIGSSYINIGQNTIYLQKFHVHDTNNGELFWHQYMTNVLAPYSESNIIYKGYANSNLLDLNMNFIIPVYDNMPEIQEESPAINPSDYEEDNTKVYANVETTLNVRSGPSTSYEKITSVSKNETMTRIARGKQSGELWDRVILENGIVGYVFQNYIEELPEIEVEEIKISVNNPVIQKNEISKLNIEIYPKEAEEQTVEYISSNEKIVKVDINGNLYGVSSGKATITVRAISNGVKASIDIEVYSKVTGIEVNIENITLQEGEQYQIVTNIEPEDANNKIVQYVSENSDVASVTENGLITAVQTGNTNIQVFSEEDEDINQTIQVNVIEKIAEEDLSFSDNIQVNGNEISGIEEENRTVEKLLENILVSEKYQVQIVDKAGNLLQNQNLVGTGSKVQIYTNTDSQTLVAEYEILIYGDVDGNGKINSVDLLKLQRHILELEELDFLSQKAGNINKNGKKPTSVDLLLIQRHILGLKQIEQ